MLSFKWTASAVPIAALLLVCMHGCGSDRPAPAGVGAGLPGTSFVGPCSGDTTRSCHEVVVQHAGYEDCFDGTQTCVGGTWSPCMGAAAATGQVATSVVGGSLLHVASLSGSTPSGFPCSTNSCDPNCNGFNEVPPVPISNTGCGNGGFFIGNAGYNSLSSALRKNPVTCIQNQLGCTTRTNVIDGNVKCDDCNYDMHCVAGACTPYLLGGSTAAFPADCAAGNRHDFTIEYPCKTASEFHITVCNRGLDDADAGNLKIGVYNNAQIKNCAKPAGLSPNGNIFAQADLSTTTIKAGRCFEFNSSNTTILNTANVVQPVANFIAQITDQKILVANWDASIAECNYCNNDSAWQNGVNCTTVGAVSTTYAETYNAVCGPGYVPQWSLLAYNVSTPLLTDVKFAVQTGPAATGPWTPAVAAQVAVAPTDHPSACSMTGPSPCGGGYAAGCKCPVDMFPALSSPAPLSTGNARQSFLNLNVTFDATVYGCAGATGLQTTGNGTNAGCSGAQDDFATSGCTADPYYKCQQDFHCNTGTGACDWNIGPPQYVDLSCKDAAGLPGIDLQIGAPCGSTIPVCNRGGGTLTAGRTFDIEITNSGGALWDCSPGGLAATPLLAPVACTYTTTGAGIGPGQCVNVTGCNLGTGQRDLYVNANLAITECGAGFPGGSSAGGGCRNNATHVKATGNGCPVACSSPPPVTTQPALNNWQVTYDCLAAE